MKILSKINNFFLILCNDINHVFKQIAMKIKILPFFLLPTIILSSCTNDSTDDLVSFNPNQEVKYST